MRFRDIPQLIQSGSYSINVSWDYLEEQLNSWMDRGCEEIAPLDIDPEFQRGHVWTQKQQIEFVEFKLSGGTGSNVILFNCPGWLRDYAGQFVLVDGKQRLEAVRSFMNNKIKAFGYYHKDFTDKIRTLADFIFQVNDLKTEKEVLLWYLQLNSGGTPHTDDELNKVRKMLKD